MTQSPGASHRFPRGLVIRALGALARESITVEDAITLEERQGPLDPVSRAWARDVTAGVLRHQGVLLGLMRSLLDGKTPTGWLRRAVYVALYQMLYHDVPYEKVVNETVQLAKRQEGEARGRFVNAVLRKAFQHKEAWQNFSLPSLDSIRKLEKISEQNHFWEALETFTSLPRWWLEKWIAYQDRLGSKGIEYFLASMRSNPVFFATLPKEKDIENVPIPKDENAKEYLARLRSEGRRVVIQDQSSFRAIQAVLKQIQEVGLKETPILDLCAAPGGKSIALAWAGMKVLSTDMKPERLEVLKSAISELAPEIEVLPWDQVENTVAPLKSLHVWLDAPCTSSGLIRKHPEIKFHKKQEELAELVEIQSKLLTKAYQLSKPGGFLIYSVCSLFAEEGEDQIKQFVLKHKNVKMIEQHVLGLDDQMGDGFYFAILKV